jgi:hypothetical protein
MTSLAAPERKLPTIRSLAARAPGLESMAALAACTIASVVINWRLFRPNVLSADALVHQYWMWRWRDPALFTDPLTADLRSSSRYPEGYEALYRVASQVVDPIVFGEWLGVALMALSAWLIFCIVREHTSWRPAGWFAAALFLALIDIHRFYAGFPRAFVQPVVLLTVLLALKRRHASAAVAAGGGALFYPPAALLAVGVLAASAVRWAGRRPRLDARRAWFALLAAAIAGVAVLGPQLVSGGAPRVFTADEARAFPEFGANGTLPIFGFSIIDYLTHNRTGFDLRTSGSILVLAALALLLARPANFRLLRTEVLAMPVVSLAAFGVAQAVLFRLYLPHRYTYPLIAFSAIVVGVALGPTWAALWARPRPRLRAFALLCAPMAIVGLALYVFPLGPSESPTWTTAAIAAGTVAVGGALALLLGRGPAAVGAVLAGVTLFGAILMLPGRLERGTTCLTGKVTAFLNALPKDAVIAGDPADLKCLPVTTRRAVVISTQLAPAYEVDYFHKGRARMFATLRAYYGPSAEAIADLRDRYGVTHLWVRRDAVRKEMAAADGVRWRGDKEPYGRYVRELLSAGEPAVLHLPVACREFANGPVEVYDVRCIARELPSTAPRASSA